MTVGSLALFSTETGDAWLLDPADHLAARLARDGDPEEVYFEETDTRFAIGWTGNYRIDGDAFVYIDRDSGESSPFSAIPFAASRNGVDQGISKIFGWFYAVP